MDLSSESLWQDAVSFAARQHRHGVRKDGVTPYIAHPMRVCLTVRQVFQCDDPVVLAAAMLHDTIEDTNTDFDELQQLFGKEVADTVAALTKNAALPEDRRERRYDEGLAKATWKARLVKLGDVYDNVLDSGERFGASGGATPRAIEKARRALKLAQADAAAHPESKRAVEAVTALIKTFEESVS